MRNVNKTCWIDLLNFLLTNLLTQAYIICNSAHTPTMLARITSNNCFPAESCIIKNKNNTSLHEQYLRNNQSCAQSSTHTAAKVTIDYPYTSNAYLAVFFEQSWTALVGVHYTTSLQLTSKNSVFISFYITSTCI